MCDNDKDEETFKAEFEEIAPGLYKSKKSTLERMREMGLIQKSPQPIYKRVIDYIKRLW